jgi:hypothetical protein
MPRTASAGLLAAVLDLLLLLRGRQAADQVQAGLAQGLVGAQQDHAVELGDVAVAALDRVLELLEQRLDDAILLAVPA